MLMGMVFTDRFDCNLVPVSGCINQIVGLGLSVKDGHE